jgi:GNAT superfamily N-acetyltransferase
MKLDEPRLATAEDEPIFALLVARFMQEQSEEGDLIVPNQRNLNVYLSIFRHYVNNPKAGICMLVGDYAMSLHGEVPGAFELSIGKVAWLWCLYYEPEYRSKGLSHPLHELAMRELKARGFEASMASVRPDNWIIRRAWKGGLEGKRGAGFLAEYMTSFWWSLKEGSDESTEALVEEPQGGG